MPPVATAREGVRQAAIGALAFMLACLAHEAVGHGGLCIALGGRITLLSSVYFRCSQSHPLVDAAGPAMNLVAGAACWGVLAVRAPASRHWRAFLALGMAFNLFWGSGYLLYSAVGGEGDWAFVLRDLALQPPWAWRWAMGVLGAVLYAGSLRLVGAKLPPGLSTTLAWVVGGLASCVAVLFFRGAVAPALSQAAWESVGAAAGLLLLARGVPAMTLVRGAASAHARDRGGQGWVAAAIVAFAAFVATLGRGLP
jgi:hypothetical protein